MRADLLRFVTGHNDHETPRHETYFVTALEPIRIPNAGKQTKTKALAEAGISTSTAQRACRAARRHSQSVTG
jgi:hypothetical protein